MAEARHFPSSHEITALRAKHPPQQENAGRGGQTSQDKTWKYLCLAVSLILLLMLILLCVVLSKVLKRTQQVHREVIQVNEKVMQGLGDARHDLDFIRGEMFRQMKAVLTGNESSCEPCPLDWKAFQGSCYFFSLDNVTWTLANDSCAQKQAHLVIVNSRAEQDFLMSTEEVTSWIGLFREGQKGNHRWMDGSAPTYSNGKPKEVRDDGTAPACATIHNQGYRGDFSCESETFAFICERRQKC